MILTKNITAVHAARIGVQKCLQNFFENPEGKRHLGRPRHKRRIILNVILGKRTVAV
jgi:hypothetical protein